MPKNKEGKSFSLTGILDLEKMMLHYIDKDGEVVFDLGKELSKYDGCEISISVNTHVDIEPVVG